MDGKAKKHSSNCFKKIYTLELFQQFDQAQMKTYILIEEVLTA